MSAYTEKKVLLFGSFDGIHPGHEYLINQALLYGSKIVLVVAQDDIITAIKKRPPENNLSVRMLKLSEQFPKAIVVPGDAQQGMWSVIKDYRPETVVVGYDQNKLRDALEKIKDEYHFDLKMAPSFFPEKYKSSLLRKKNF